MMRPLRRLALAAALYTTLGVGVAAAQTVIVTNAPPKGPIQLVLNLATIASATADEAGDARLTFNVQTALKKAEADVNIYVDVCGDARTIFLVERGVLPAATATGCNRHEVPGLYVMKPVTNLLVDAVAARPAVWLKQGPVPKEWLMKGVESEPRERTWRPAPTGLVIFAGGALPSFADYSARACGDVSDCKSDAARRSYTVGAEVWITRWLSAEGSYFKSAQLTASGSGSTFHFNSSFAPDIIMAAGKIGVPIGPVRVYGKAGMDYHRGVTKTSDTIDNVTITVDGVEQTIQGGTQTTEVKTRGWGLLFGGGLEAWVSRRVALYAEAGRARVKGDPENGGEATFDDRMIYAAFGLRLHIGK